MASLFIVFLRYSHKLDQRDDIFIVFNYFFPRGLQFNLIDLIAFAY